MPVIDADAHVIETEHTWEYVPDEDAKHRPQILTDDSGAKFWVIDGKIRGRARGPVAAKGIANTVSRNMVTDEAKRYMEDIPGRLAHMDELGIDVQVLYPTMYINRMADNPDTDIVISKSYNRWLADIWEQGGKGRLLWTAILPMSDIDEAVKELRWCVEHGCVGVTMRSIEDERLMNDPYWAPLYNEAIKLNVPITVHIGNSNLSDEALWAKDAAGGTFGRFRLMSVAACHLLITNEIPKQYPGLRFGFIEASSQWVPYMIHDLRRRLETRGRKLDDEPLKANNIWVTCQTDDDLPYVIKYAGDSQIVIGTDYGHQDQSAEIEALRNLREEGGLDPAVVDKILGPNAAALYGL